MPKKCYRISKILNNNAVEVCDDGTEIIVIAAGIGFTHKVKDYLVIKDDFKLYTLQSSLLKHQFEALLNEIPFECVQLTQNIVDMAKEVLNQEFKPGLLVSLSDHIHFVVKTYMAGKESYSLVSEEIKRLYKAEHKVGLRAVEMINEHYKISLSAKEASAITFHLINSEYGNNISQTTTILNSIDDILNIVKSSAEGEISEDSLAYSRFIIHLKFFMQRVINGEQEDNESFERLLLNLKSEESRKIGAILYDIGAYIFREFEHQLSDTERFYLLIYIARLI